MNSKILALGTCLLAGSLLVAAPKLKFEPDFTGTYAGTFTDGKFDFTYQGKKITGAIKTKPGLNDKKKITINLDFDGKPLTYEATVLTEMKDGIFAKVKCLTEDFKYGFGAFSLEGSIGRDELLDVSTAISFKDKNVTGKAPFDKIKLDFGDFVLAGKRTGLSTLDFDFSIGKKKILANSDWKIDIFKGTMAGTYNLKLGELTNDELALALFVTVLSEVYSGRGN